MTCTKCGSTQIVPRARVMFAAGLYQTGSASTSPTVFMILEGFLLVVALVITFQAYRREGA